MSVLESASSLVAEEEVGGAWHRRPELPPLALCGGWLERLERVEACTVAAVLGGGCKHGIECAQLAAVQLAEVVQLGDLAPYVPSHVETDA